MLKMFGVVVAIGIGVLVLVLLIDLSWYLWSGLGVLLSASCSSSWLAYLVDRRKVKEYEDLIADRSPFS